MRTQTLTSHLKFHIQQGILSPAESWPSPNFNERPAHTLVDLLVIHNISLPPGVFGGGHVKAFFQNALNPSAHPYFASIAHLQVSAHCFIARTGQVSQCVNFNKRAWHAGVSSFEGRAQCNDYSIGIELEGTDTLPYTQAQYEALAAVTRALQVAYPSITAQRIVGHNTIAPERKTDPGEAFDWPFFKALLV